MTGVGVWIDGKYSPEEKELQQSLIKKAVEYFKDPVNKAFSYDGEKLWFKALMIGDELHVFYGWKFPPSQYWRAGADKLECNKCFPKGTRKVSEREAWCTHPDYNYGRCPYGVITPLKPLGVPFH